MLKPTYTTNEVEKFAESLGVDFRRCLKPGIRFEDSELYPDWIKVFSNKIQQLWVVSESVVIESNPKQYLVIDICLN